MGAPSPQLVAERLMCDDETAQQRSTGRLGVELRDDRIDQTREFGKEPSVMAEIRPQRLRHGEHELPERKIEKNLGGQVFCEKERALLTARRTQIETLAGKWTEIVVTARRIDASDSSDAEPVVAAGKEPIAMSRVRSNLNMP